MITIQKIFALSFFAFIALFSQHSNAQTSGSNNFERKHLSTITHSSPTAGATTGSNIDIAGLPDGVNVIAQTREHVLLAAIIEKGRLVGMGSINPRGSFNRFTPDTPCSGFIVQPCADGSAPGSYFDGKKCIGYCTGYIVIDPNQYQRIKSYLLKPNGPCSNFIAQPCRKGTSMVIYYDAHTEKCVMMCDY